MRSTGGTSEDRTTCSGCYVQVGFVGHSLVGRRLDFAQM